MLSPQPSHKPVYLAVPIASRHHHACSAKSLVRELLTTNPSKRLTASQALKHSWFSASLQSNEDLRLARRNMKRHLRQRFKVSHSALSRPVMSSSSSTNMSLLNADFTTDRHTLLCTPEPSSWKSAAVVVLRINRTLLETLPI